VPDTKDHSLGRLAVRAGLLAESELEEVLLEQERRGPSGPEGTDRVPLGELMVELGYVAPRQIRRLLGAQAVARSKVTRVGPYELIAKLGEGGMGAVYQGRDLRSGELVAIKILPRSKARDPEFLARFEQEARAVFELDHPNIVRAVGLGEADGYHYLAMEYVEGRDVYDMLDESGRISEIDAVSIAIQVAQALEHSGAEQVVHRDIKPGNILVDRHGMAKLTDFGLALDRDREGRGRITDGHEALGTPFYLSPEQARGDPDVDVRSDIYALGATLYEMVTGRPPFEGSPAEVLSKHLHQQIASPRDIDRTLSPGLCHIVQKMMAKRLEDRYGTPRELLKDLMLVYQGRDPVSERLPPGRSSVRASVRPVARGHRRHRRVHHAAGSPARAAARGPRRSAGGSAEERDPPRGGAEATHYDEDVAADVQERHDRSRAAPGTGGPPARRSVRRRLRRDVRRATLLVLVAAAVALLAFIAAAVLVLPAGQTRDRASAFTPPSGSGVLVKSDFESGSPESWDGTVSRKGAGEGSYSLLAPRARPPGQGLRARLEGSVVAGHRVEVAFLYYVTAPGPIVVEFDYKAPGARERSGAIRFSHPIPNPTRDEWAAVRIAETAFTGPPGAYPDVRPGGVLGGLTIGAPQSGPRDILALDAVWLWTDGAGAR
jgi:serine/threonine-protein kinase